MVLAHTVTITYRAGECSGWSRTLYHFFPFSHSLAYVLHRVNVQMWCNSPHHHHRLETHAGHSRAAGTTTTRSFALCSSSCGSRARTGPRSRYRPETAPTHAFRYLEPQTSALQFSQVRASGNGCARSTGTGTDRSAVVGRQPPVHHENCTEGGLLDRDRRRAAARVQLLSCPVNTVGN